MPSPFPHPSCTAPCPSTFGDPAVLTQLKFHRARSRFDTCVRGHGLVMGLCRWLDSSIIQVFPNLDGSIITVCSWAACWCHKGPGCSAIPPSSHKQIPLTRHKTSLAPKVLVANNHQSSVATSSRPRPGSRAAPSHLWPMHFTESLNIPSWKGPTRVTESSSQFHTGFGLWVVLCLNTT